MEHFRNLLNFEHGHTSQVFLPYERLMVLSDAKPSVGIRSEIKNGELYHILTHDILITLQQYRADEYVKASIISSEQPLNIIMEEKEVPLHYNDFIQISYVISGTLTVLIDGQTFTFKEDELYIIDRNAYHKEVLDDSDAVVLNIGMYTSLFDEMLLSNIKENSLQGFIRQCLLHDKNKRKFLRFTPHDTTNAHALSSHISDIFIEAKTKRPGYLYVIKGYLIRLMDFLAGSYKPAFNDNKRKKYQEYLFQEIEAYILTHYKDIQMKDLVKKFHYQTNYFNKLIHEYTGMSYSDYLITIRIHRAKTLLETTALSIDDIMDEVGYHNKGFFYKIFREKTGFTPADYRKKHVKNSTES